MAHGLAEAFLLFKLHYDYIGEKGSGSLDVINEHIVSEAFLWCLLSVLSIVGFSNMSFYM